MDKEENYRRILNFDDPNEKLPYLKPYDSFSIPVEHIIGDYNWGSVTYCRYNSKLFYGKDIIVAGGFRNREDKLPIALIQLKKIGRKYHVVV